MAKKVSAWEFVFRMTDHGTRTRFVMKYEDARQYGGVLGQLVGQGFLKREVVEGKPVDAYELTPKGEQKLADKIIEKQS